MAAAPGVFRHLASETLWPTWFAEGDRLAHKAFIGGLLAEGWDVRVAHLSGPAVAATRRLTRGSAQSASWVKGRQTKCRRLAQTYNAVEIDAARPPEAVAAQLREEDVRWLS
jgi:hypothetical protein